MPARTPNDPLIGGATVPRTPGPYAKARRVLFLSAALLCMLVRPAPAQVTGLDRSVAAGYLRQAEELFARATTQAP